MAMARESESELSVEELRNAGIKAFENASELVEEAQVLHKHGHLSRALFLCCISGEELGKSFISLSAVANRITGAFDEKRYKERFRAHREKTGVLMFLEDVFVFELPPELPKVKRDAEAVEKSKLSALYCDFYGTEAQKPSEVIPEHLVNTTLEVAKQRLKYFADNVRPKFDYVLEIDKTKAIQFQREFLQTMAAHRDADSKP